MLELKNNRLLRALKRQDVDCTPVWIMRQAGRYLPEYLKTRALARNFVNLCKTPELACEVALQPLKRFDLDAAILFSDILTIPDALGLGLYFESGEGPKFRHVLRSANDIKALPELYPEQSLDYVMETIRLIQNALAGKVPLIGFSGSPWTLATYMVEGGSSKDFRFIKGMMFSQPELLHVLLEKLANAISAYLQAQIQHGVQVIQIFDTWGGILTKRDYLEFSLTYMKKIVTNLKQQGLQVPIILFTKNGGSWLEHIAATGADAVAIDWTCDLHEAVQRVGDKVAIQGNMDPAVLYGPATRIRQEVKNIVKQMNQKNGHVFNLGHGIQPHVKPNQVAIMVDAVHEFSRRF